jgi:hypothetical protein
MSSTHPEKKRRSVLRLWDMVVVWRVATTEGLRMVFISALQIFL